MSLWSRRFAFVVLGVWSSVVSSFEAAGSRCAVLQRRRGYWLYESRGYREVWLPCLVLAWSCVSLRGLQQSLREGRRFAKRGRRGLWRHLPVSVGAAFFVLGALRCAFLWTLLVAPPRRAGCVEVGAGSRAAFAALFLQEAPEPLLLVALSSIALYWWQLADVSSRKVGGRLEGKSLVVFVAGNVAFLATTASAAAYGATTRVL